MNKRFGRFLLVTGLGAGAFALAQAGGADALRDLRPERFLEGGARLPSLATPFLLLVGSAMSLTGGKRESS
jgi:hypothetical protein